MKRLAMLGMLAGIAMGAAMPPALAFTPVSELKDISPDHWAYNAVKALVERYQIMEGFPDSTFRGTRTISRFELAAALSKVLARVDEMVAAATGEAPQPTRIQPSVTADDLRTIARLQQEFKDELSALKGRVDTQDQRLATLEKRVRIGGSLEAFYRTYTVQPRATQLSEMDDLRLATHLSLETNLSSELAYRGQFTLFNAGVQSYASGHLATEGGRLGYPGDTGTPLYVRRSYFSWTPANLNVHAGMMTFSDTLKIGSTLRNEFRTAPVWPHAEGGYGFVGTPPLQSPATPGTSEGQLILAPAEAAASLPTIPGRIRWNPGVNVAEDLLDPNSVWAVNSGTAPAVVVDSYWGPVEVGVGLNYGSPGASTQLALADSPRTFPLIAEYYHGYGLLKMGADLGLARVGLYGHLDNGSVSQLTTTSSFLGKGVGTTVDFGSDALGLSLGHAQVTRRNYDPNYYAESSAFLVSNNLFGTGMGIGLGTKFGDSPATNAATRILSVMPYDWTSTGAYVRTPGISIFPSLVIAAQTSGRDFFGSDLGSGLSAILEIQLASTLPNLMLEYDMGRFYGTSGTPGSGNPASDNQLIGGGLQTHEQIVLGTSLKF